MPTEFWYPITGAIHDLPARGGGGDNWSTPVGGNVNYCTRPTGGRAGPMAHDDDASYCATGTNGDTFGQAMNPDFPGPVASLTAFTIAHRYQSVMGGGGWDSHLTYIKWIDAAGASGAVIYTAGDNGSYNSVTPLRDCYSSRPGGGNFIASDFKDDKTIFPCWYLGGLVDDQQKITSVWGELTYSPPAGGFAFLLGLAGLCALLNGPMDYSHFEKFLEWRYWHHPRGTIMLPGEKEQAWIEYKEYRHPRYFYG